MGNIALTDVIPQDSLERQLYFIEKCKRAPSKNT
jgi:hypothetical protein